MKLDSQGKNAHAMMLRLPLPQPETLMTNHGGLQEQMEDSRIIGPPKFMKTIEEECNSSSSSSIGENSDEDDDNDGDHAQSLYRYNHNSNNINKISNGSFDDAVQALEEALPIRKGISTFYNGKSKSFACLADVWRSSPPSIKDIAKPENAYTRKRRNLVASTVLLSSNINTGRISKKPKTTTLCFASKIKDCDLNKHTTRLQVINKPLLLKKQNLSTMRSFSMVNLQRCTSRFGLNSTEIENC